LYQQYFTRILWKLTHSNEKLAVHDWQYMHAEILTFLTVYSTQH